MGADHTSVLFHSEARWLSRGKLLLRVFELREVIQIFLEEAHMYEAASKFSDEQFLLKLAYLSSKEKTSTYLTWQTKSLHSPESSRYGEGASINKI